MTGYHPLLPLVTTRRAMPAMRQRAPVTLKTLKGAEEAISLASDKAVSVPVGVSLMERHPEIMRRARIGIAFLVISGLLIQYDLFF